MTSSPQSFCFRRARVWRKRLPREISVALTSARLTALAKLDGGVRGIATGCTLRRLMARTLAKHFMKDFEQECAPFQYALSARAGTDCFGHVVRVSTDADHGLTILSMDGIGAYDHVLPAAMLTKLSQMPEARKLLPFVRLSYAGLSSYTWFDEKGKRHVVNQAEGGEQGDPLMPLLFSIGSRARWKLSPGNCRKGNTCSRFSTMCTFCANHIGCTLCMDCSRPLCGESLAFVFTRGRRGRGTRGPLFQSALRTSASMRGSQQESKFSALRSVPTNLSPRR